MKNILVLSQKGGTGKTTLADNITFMLEADGYEVSFFDLDPQGGAIHETTDNESAEYAVIDTPGILTDDTKDLIKDASVIVLPTRASVLDMQPLERTRALIAKVAPTVPIVIVLNGFNRWSNAKDFREWLESEPKPTESITVLSQSERIPQAAADSKGVLEYAPKSKPAMELQALYAQIMGVLNGR